MRIGPFGLLRIVSAILTPTTIGNKLYRALIYPREFDEYQHFLKLILVNFILLLIKHTQGYILLEETIARIQFNKEFTFYIFFSITLNFILIPANIERKTHFKSYLRDSDKRKNRIKLWNLINLSFYIFLLTILTYAIKFVMITFGTLQPDQTVFEISNTRDNKKTSFFLTYIKSYLLESIILSAILIILVLYTTPFKIIFKNFSITIDIKTFSHFYTTLFFILVFKSFNLHAYIISVKSSHFMEHHYSDPLKTNLTFPTTPRNLIVILLESVESTFMSKSTLGGAFNASLIPDLEKLALDHRNTQFSHTSLGGGIQQTVGSTWSTGGLFTMNCGMPLKQKYFHHTYYENGEFVPGAICLGDILKEHGYSRTFIVGEMKDHQRFDQLFTTHGQFEILDQNSITETGRYDEYKTRGYWGYEDKVTIDFMKEVILRKVNEKKPFYIFTKTIDTHVDGVEGTTCETRNDEQLIVSLLRCNSRMLSDFVEWFNENKLYENTTLAMIGDHFIMGRQLHQYIKNTTRTVFNLFLNMKTTEKISKNRIFSTFDFFPTFLHSIGVKIDGNKLGLGTNLFSREKTLAEKYGNKKLSEYLTMSSTWYDEVLLGEIRNGINVNINATWINSVVTQN